MVTYQAPQMKYSTNIMKASCTPVVNFILSSVLGGSNIGIKLHLFRRTLEDCYRHKGLRRQLVDVIRQKGITDERVLDAILHIPRHFFMDSAFDKIAYEDRAFPIAEGQTI